MPNVATARTTTGSLFGAFAAAGGAVSSVFEATTKSVTFLDTFVSNALAHQQMRIDADNASFAIRLQQEKAQELALLSMEAHKFCDQSAQHESEYKSAFDLIGRAIEEGKARRSRPST